MAPGGGSSRPSGSSASPWTVGVLHALVAVAAVIGVMLQLVRPLAPELGPPPDPATWFDPAFLERAAGYRQPLYAVGLAAIIIRLAVPMSLALTAAGRRVTERLVGRVGEQRPASAAAAVVLVVLSASEVAVFPLAYWAGYIHDGRYGLRTHGLGGWLYDWGVVTGMGLVAAAVATMLGYTLIRRLPRLWPPVAVAVGGVLTTAVVLLGPVVLEPLLFRTEPLPDGPVRTEVERVVERSGIAFDRILVADASRRTTRRNAYVSGLWDTRRVVLYDTLVENQEPAEVGAVLAHELGHHAHADLARGIMLSVAGLAAAVYGLAVIAHRRVRTGKQRSMSDPRGVAVLLAVVVVLNTASLPVQNLVSRRAEAAADLAALQLTGDPVTFSAMNTNLVRSNLSAPRPPTWVYVLWSTHPMPVSRLEMAERWTADPPGPR